MFSRDAERSAGAALRSASRLHKKRRSHWQARIKARMRNPRWLATIRKIQRGSDAEGEEKTPCKTLKIVNDGWPCSRSWGCRPTTSRPHRRQPRRRGRRPHPWWKSPSLRRRWLSRPRWKSRRRRPPNRLRSRPREDDANALTPRRKKPREQYDLPCRVPGSRTYCSCTRLEEVWERRLAENADDRDQCRRQDRRARWCGFATHRRHTRADSTDSVDPHVQRAAEDALAGDPHHVAMVPAMRADRQGPGGRLGPRQLCVRRSAAASARRDRRSRCWPRRR